MTAQFFSAQVSMLIFTENISRTGLHVMCSGEFAIRCLFSLGLGGLAAHDSKE